eukprot:TRINITY_DN29899_c0_g1_i1.p1 TRINITY_DN29899_c0_g1~~TRINITY_DN29899_c0_g1_i1.p1  ORF type:complete len:587 (+),score=187.19 TRINITY_DN29899_c0_g1_i1:92-1852(+)
MARLLALAVMLLAVAQGLRQHKQGHRGRAHKHGSHIIARLSPVSAESEETTKEALHLDPEATAKEIEEGMVNTKREAQLQASFQEIDSQVEKSWQQKDDLELLKRSIKTSLELLEQQTKQLEVLSQDDAGATSFVKKQSSETQESIAKYKELVEKTRSRAEDSSRLALELAEKIQQASELQLKVSGRAVAQAEALRDDANRTAATANMVADEAQSQMTHFEEEGSALPAKEVLSDKVTKFLRKEQEHEGPAESEAGKSTQAEAAEETPATSSSLEEKLPEKKLSVDTQDLKSIEQPLSFLQKEAARRHRGHRHDGANTRTLPEASGNPIAKAPAEEHLDTEALVFDAAHENEMLKDLKADVAHAWNADERIRQLNSTLDAEALLEKQQLSLESVLPSSQAEAMKHEHNMTSGMEEETMNLRLVARLEADDAGAKAKRSALRIKAKALAAVKASDMALQKAKEGLSAAQADLTKAKNTVARAREATTFFESWSLGLELEASVKASLAQAAQAVVEDKKPEQQQASEDLPSSATEMKADLEDTPKKHLHLSPPPPAEKAATQDETEQNVHQASVAIASFLQQDGLDLD